MTLDAERPEGFDPAEQHDVARRNSQSLTRRRMLQIGAGAAVVASAAVLGVEMADRTTNANSMGATASCEVPTTRFDFGAPGPTRSGGFFSRARGREVGYTIGYPPGYGPGDELPLIVMLHGYGNNHRRPLAGLAPAQALSIRHNGRTQVPMAMVTVDGGRGFWNPHPGDDAGAMVVDELVPMCRRLGLGRAPARVGIMGISMGGYGAILLAERHRRLFSAVAAISPAIFEDFHVAQSMFPSAFASDASFQATDVITHVSQLAGLPVLISSGQGDPFHPGVAALARVLPRSAQVHFPVGCHTRTFFAEQVMPSLLFMGSHIGRSESRTRQA